MTIFTVEATLKSGTIIQFKCSKIEVNSTSIKWTTAKNHFPYLLDIIPSEVASYIITNEEEVPDA